MSDYLDRLEIELRRAIYHEPRRVWPARAAGATVTAAVVVVVFLVAAGSGAPSVERTVEPATSDVQVQLAAVPTHGLSSSINADGLVSLSVSVVLGEPATIEVSVSEDGEMIASVEERGVDVGEKTVRLPLPDLAGTQVDVMTRVTDTAGNVRTFDRSTAVVQVEGPVEPALSVLDVRDDLVDSTPIPGFPDFDVVAGDAEIHQLIDDPRSDVYIASGPGGACVAYDGADGLTAAQCWPFSEQMNAGRNWPQLERGVLFALVPDGTSDVRIVTDHEAEYSLLGGNVIAYVPDGPVRQVSWTAPDGSTQIFDRASGETALRPRSREEGESPIEAPQQPSRATIEQSG